MGCAGVWALILAAGNRWADPEERAKLRLACAGWWMGWASASVARAAYPPPKRLDPTAEKRLANVSLALIALGLAGVLRSLTTRRAQAR